LNVQLVQLDDKIISGLYTKSLYQIRMYFHCL